MAVSLPRAEDFELVPAWLELSGQPPTSVPATWSAVTKSAAAKDSAALVDRARLLGLPVCRLGEVAPTRAVTEMPLGDAPGRNGAAGLLVVDLSALWAGPLCGDLLGRKGASVVKVESMARPDGARRGPAAFFDLLNGHKRSVALDFTQVDDIRALQQIVQRADIVIEASRPRALTQLGIDAAALVRSGGPQVWVSITGYGRGDEGADRVAFGDDAAVAGGLVAWSGSATTPAFCADAIGDPLTGLTAAVACLDALSRGGRWLLDVSMAAVCASMAGPTLPSDGKSMIAEPRARSAARAAPELGADTAAVLTELGIQM
jgi:crotonobetainyl-CoA:carnitine CoA-transferase CaiB-like acyl-CoA transferase